MCAHHCLQGSRSCSGSQLFVKPAASVLAVVSAAVMVQGALLEAAGPATALPQLEAALIALETASGAAQSRGLAAQVRPHVLRAVMLQACADGRSTQTTHTVDCWPRCTCRIVPCTILRGQADGSEICSGRSFAPCCIAMLEAFRVCLQAERFTSSILTFLSRIGRRISQDELPNEAATTGQLATALATALRCLGALFGN